MEADARSSTAHPAAGFFFQIDDVNERALRLPAHTCAGKHRILRYGCVFVNI
jgi:hypothetical protein